MGDILLLALVAVAVLAIPVVVFGPVAVKAGFSRWWSLVLILPFVNLFAIWLFAFIEWPAEKDAAATDEGDGGQPPRLGKG